MKIFTNPIWYLGIVITLMSSGTPMDFWHSRLYGLGIALIWGAWGYSLGKIETEC